MTSTREICINCGQRYGRHRGINCPGQATTFEPTVLDPRKYVVFDVEADNLLYGATKMHCIVLRIVNEINSKFHNEIYFNMTPGLTYVPDGTIDDGIARLVGLAERGYTLVGHNVCGYDFPLFKKLGHYYPCFDPTVDPGLIIDTYIGVSLRFPEESAGLAYWGTKFGISKPAHEDWSTLSDQMINRCIQDVKINEELLFYLSKHEYFIPDFIKSSSLEQQVLWIHSQQVLHGFRVDIVKSKETLVAIDKRISKLSKRLHKLLPTTCVAIGTEVSKVFKVDGSLTKMVTDWFEPEIHPMSSFRSTSARLPFPKTDVRIGGPFTRITFEPVNLNSHPKVKELLLSLGWKPREWNFKILPDGTKEKTSPKLTENSYDSLPPGLGQDLAEYLKLCHRRRFILNEKTTDKGLLSYVRSDGRVECDAYTCGTNTGRYRHTGAFVNLPSNDSYLGKEIRDLFTVPYNRLLIGIDLSGIEARMMGHYASFYDKGAYATKILSGDVHSGNAKALGVSRETAKTFLYAVSYGAGDGKLASILGCTVAQAKKKINSFWKENHGLRKLIDALESQYTSNGYIIGLDGRHLYIRQKHKLLNSLIQNAATVVFKQWMINCWSAIDALGIPAAQVLAYHDELGWEYYGPDPVGAEDTAVVFVKEATNVQLRFGLNVPIDAAFKIGTRYSEVHS